MNLTRSAGLAAGTTVHTPQGLRRVEDLMNGDVVLTSSADGGAAIPKRVIAVSGPTMRPAFRVRGYGMNGDENVDQLVVVAGDQLFHVVGAVDADPDYPPPAGWIEALRLFRSQVLQQAAGGGAQVSSVDPIWRTRSEGLGWIDLDRESDAGWTIDLRSAPPVEARPVPGAVADFAGDPSFLDRYNDEEIAQECAYKCAMHGLAVEDGAPFFVGDRGFVVASL